MARGLQVFNADGSLQFDTGNRLFRTLTSVLTGTTGGSIPIPPNAGGTVIPQVTPSSDSGQAAHATVSGGNITWGFTAPPANRTDGTLNVLVY